MAQAAAVVSIVSAVYGAYSSYQGQKRAEDAADEQERMAAKNAAYKEAETREEARRAEKAADEDMAKSRALAAGSGVEREGSMDIFMGAQQDEFNRQIDWLRQSGKSQTDIIRQGGSYASDQTRAQGDAQFAQGIGSSIEQAGSGASSLYDNYQKTGSWF